MNISRKILLVLLVGLLAACGRQVVASPTDVASNAPYIELAGEVVGGVPGTGTRTCQVAVPVPGGNVLQIKMKDTRCGQDYAGFFKLHNVPSTTVVHFSSETSCNDGDWKYGVRATKQPTSSIWIGLEQLSNATVGTILAAGVEVSYRRYEEGQGSTKEKLSCVIVYPAEL